VQASLGEMLLGLSLMGLLFDFGFVSPSLGSLVRFSGRGMLVNSTGLVGEDLLNLLFVGVFGTLVVNSSLILSQNNSELFPISKLSHPLL